MCSLELGLATLQGTYRSQAGGEQGTFVVDLVDGLGPGPSGGDTFSITLLGDIAHTNAGPVQGGSVKVR